MNDTELDWLGYERLDVVGKLQFVELLSMESQATFLAVFPSIIRLRPELEVELDLLTREGRVRPCLASAKAVHDASDDTVIVRWAVVLIEERRKSEQLVREGEARFRIMADSAPVALWMAGEDAKCQFFNQYWLTFTGPTLEQEVGDGWAEGVHPLDFQRCVATYLEAFNARRMFEVEYRLRRADGEYRWILDHGAPRFTPDGHFAGYIGSCIDITVRKRAESERTQLLARAEAARAEAEDAVLQRDQFLIVAAHELKTPMTSLWGCVQLLIRRSDELAPDGDLYNRRQLRTIYEQTRRLSSLVSRLLDLSCIQPGRLALETQPVDHAQLVTAAVALHETGAAGQLLVRAAAPALVNLDTLRIEQVVANLLDNAVKFSPGGEPVEIEVSLLDTGAARMVVRDHGIGIPLGKRDNIFDRFYQAHSSEHRSGLGLGLYISREIVELHGGRISVEFPPDGGTCFTVELPVRVEYDPSPDAEALAA